MMISFAYDVSKLYSASRWQLVSGSLLSSVDTFYVYVDYSSCCQSVSTF